MALHGATYFRLCLECKFWGDRSLHEIVLIFDKKESLEIVKCLTICYSDVVTVPIKLTCLPFGLSASLLALTLDTRASRVFVSPLFKAL